MRVFVIAGAGVMTVALLGVMTVLIADEFEPQDTVELSAFEINPKPDDIPLLADRTPPKLLDRIEVPPPLPRLDIVETNRPSEPITETFDPDTKFDSKLIITKTVFKIIPSDTDPVPIVRVSPVMPPRADRSGHCRMSFDISSDGKPFNVQATICSQRLFERSAVRSVQKWVYRPKIQDGLPVPRTGLETMIRFRLTDENGALISE